MPVTGSAAREAVKMVESTKDKQQSTVGVIKGDQEKGDKFACFEELLKITRFDENLSDAFDRGGKKYKNDFRIIIKPNMMVFVNPNAYNALVTDPELVEYLVDHLRKAGYTDITVCEARNDVGRMLKNHTVRFVAKHIGYQPGDRYRIADLSDPEESLKFKYVYKTRDGESKTWKDKVGKSWKEADYRITFAKCKTHEHDWMTLCVKNVYGCFPRPNKISRYHIRYEIFDTTGISLLNFPVHFAFCDGWVGSDGFQGYKINNPRPLKMFFGGPDAVAVDMETFKRAGLDPLKSRFLKKTVEIAGNGEFPEYTVVGDASTTFNDALAGGAEWANVTDDIVKGINILEEVFVAWGLINLKPCVEVVDYNLFPPKNWFTKLLVSFSKRLYWVFKLFPWYRKLYERKA